MRRALAAYGVACVAVVLFTTAVLALSGARVGPVFSSLAVGALGSWSKAAQVLTVWVPLTLCACGLLFTFRIGLWNIGVEGQVMLGAVGATWVLRAGLDTGSPARVLVLGLVAGVAAGALWALLAGLLKTRGGVNEIFAGLGLNFVAQGLLLWLIFGPWRRPGVASMSGTQPFPPDLWLPTLSGGLAWGRLTPVALGCALAALVLAGVLLGRSRVGLSLRAVGSNATASFLLGLHPGRAMLLAMGLGGGLAGLAGAIQVTAVYHRLIPAVSSNYGYLALLVAMLANFRLAPVAPVCLFFAALNVGSVQLPMVLRLDSSLSGVIQGVLVLAALVAHGWTRRRSGRRTALAQGAD